MGLRCNFEITQGVEFSGAFGCLDVHNAYELTAAEVEGQRLVLRFAANQYRIPGRPLAFEVVFEGVSHHILPADLADLFIDEIGFLGASEGDDESLSHRGKPADGELLAFRWGIEAVEGMARIAADRAEVRVTIGPPADEPAPAPRRRKGLFA